VATAAGIILSLFDRSPAGGDRPEINKVYSSGRCRQGKTTILLIVADDIGYADVNCAASVSKESKP
jgi:hypothetical protein